jgi:hypothetical protein
VSEYLCGSLAWSVVWFLTGYVFCLLDPHLRDLWKRD